MIAAAPQMVILPALQKIDFDTVKDFTPIKNIATNPFVLVVSRSQRNTGLPIGTASSTASSALTDAAPMIWVAPRSATPNNS